MAALVAVLVPAAAIGQARSHRIDLDMLLAPVGPNPPSGNLYAGQVKGKPVGTAAILARNQVSATTSTGKAVIYAKRGTIRTNVTNEIQPQPDGSVKFPALSRSRAGPGCTRERQGTGSSTALRRPTARSSCSKSQASCATNRAASTL